MPHSVLSDEAFNQQSNFIHNRSIKCKPHALDKQGGFAHAARDYDHNASLQQDVCQQLVRYSLPHCTSSAPIVDIGCGTGFVTSHIHALSTDRTKIPPIIQLDLAFAMTSRAQAKHPDAPAIQADMHHLPLAECSTGTILSSLALQWAHSPAAVFHEIQRVLTPGGVCAIATLGPRTLQELRTAFQLAEGQDTRVHHFLPAAYLCEQARHASLRTIAHHEACHQRYYPDIYAVMHSTRSIGGHNSRRDRSRYMTPRRVFTQAEQHYRTLYASGQGLPVTWDVYYVLLQKEG